MPGPYDYSAALGDPTGSFLQSLKLVQALQQQKAQEEQMRQRQQLMGRLIALGSNATANDYVQASLQLPQDAESFRKTWDMIDEGKRNAIFKGGAAAYMLADGDPAAAAQKLNDYAEGFRNSGDEEAAKQFSDAAKIVERNPKAAKATIGMMLSFADGERFKNVAQPQDATTFQKDFAFIKNTFGNDAASEFAQYGRGGIVSIPLGNGQTYVGPASSAPGASRWQEQAQETGQQPESAPEILSKAAQSKTITQAEANAIKQSLGPKGQAAFDKWRDENKIKVIVRTGTAADGRRVVQYDDGTIAYAD